MTKDAKFLVSKGLRKFFNPPAIRDSQLDETARIWDHSTVSNSTIGRYTSVGDHTLIAHSRIGSFCSISSFCQIGGGNHPIDFVSTSPLFYSGHNAFGKNFSQNEFLSYRETVIGNDVWIGAHALIRSGVAIGDGAVIGMGAVVTKNVPPYAVVAGVPAFEIRKRFSPEIIDRLLALRWWDWPEEELRQYGDLFSDPEELLCRIALKKQEEQVR